MDREAWRAAVHGITKTQTQLSDWTELNQNSQLKVVIKDSIPPRLMPKSRSWRCNDGDSSYIPFNSPLWWVDIKWDLGNYSGLWASQLVQVVKKLPGNAGDIRDTVSIPGLGRSSREESVNPLQYSCLENPMDRWTWWATVYGVAQSDMTEATSQACTHTVKYITPDHMVTPITTAF